MEKLTAEEVIVELLESVDENTRAWVAKQGYGLDKLINDENEVVRVVAAEALKRKNKQSRRRRNE